MSKSKEKLTAIDLRRQGWSIKDIARHLQVSRSSASIWCQDILLTKKQVDALRKKQILAGQVGRQKGADMNRAKRSNALLSAKAQAKVDIAEVKERDLFYLGLGLYWGEGIKSRTGQTAVVNSDPRILKVAMRWFLECLEVDRGDFRPYVYISVTHEKRANMIMNYWSKVLGLPISQFKSPIFLKQKPRKKYENHDDYFGVVALRVVKSTNLKYRILALLEALDERLE